MSALLPAMMIANYFLSRDITSIIVVSCASVDQKVDMIKILSQTGMRVSWDINHLSHYEDHRNGVTIDLTCAESDGILKHMSDRKMYGLRLEWLLMGEKQSVEDVLKPGLYILPGSSVILALSSSNSVAFYDVYRITRRLPYILTLLNETPRTAEELPTMDRPPRGNYQQNLLSTVTVIHSLNISKLTDPDPFSEDRWAVIHYAIILNLAYQLNFRFDMRVERKHGWQLANGSFDGLVGVMAREEVEFGTTGAIMRDDRRPFIDYTVDYFEFKTGVIFKQPSLSSVSNIYLLPFSLAVWLACLGLVLLTLILLVIQLKFTTDDDASQKISVFDIVTTVLGFVCQQGSEFTPVTISGRIVIFIASLAALFLYTSYSANIVALLQSTTSVLKTLKDLTQSDMGLKVQTNEYHLKYFTEAMDEDVINLYKKKVEKQPESFVNGSRGVELMRTGAFAFCVEYDIAYKQIGKTFQEEEKCGLGEMHLFFVPRLSVPVIKNSGHREHFMQKIMWQRETGMLDHISRIWLTRRPVCESKNGGYLKVGFKDFRPALSVIFGGFVVSVAVFVGEIASQKFHSIEKCHRRRGNVAETALADETIRFPFNNNNFSMVARRNADFQKDKPKYTL